jgi:putative transposase
MPRANRYFLPDHVWHITHRCHKKEFLLKFAKDRKRWLHWLFEATQNRGQITIVPNISGNCYLTPVFRFSNLTIK